MQDKELAKLFGLPTSTIADWKSKKNLNGNMKFLLYKFISSLPDTFIQERIEAIKLIEDVEVVLTGEFIEKIFTNQNSFEILHNYKLLSGKDASLTRFLSKSKIVILKNEKERYIFLHFCLPYHSNALSRIYYLEKEYKLLNETYDTDRIYLILPNTQIITNIDDPKFCKGVDNLEIINASYFSDKLYSRKNIIFWNSIGK